MSSQASDATQRSPVTRVALFPTCLGDQFYAEACADAVRLLRHLGVAVDVPKGQTCCGQPAYNAGWRSDAAAMAGYTLQTLGQPEYVVLPSGSCAGMIRHFYAGLLPDLADEARVLAERTFELSQFIFQVLGVERLGRGLEGRTIAYHHSCHALRELGVRREPLSLLAGCGAEVVEWEAAEECCGFGGLFSAKLPEVSAAMADRKLDTLPRVDFVTSTDGGCLMQLSGRAGKRGSGPTFKHLASVLWEGARGGP